MPHQLAHNFPLTSRMDRSLHILVLHNCSILRTK